MHRYNPAYPISELMMTIIQSSGLSSSKFINSIGYRRTNKGLRILTSWLEYGDGDPLLISRLLQIFPYYQQEIDVALKQTSIMKQEEKENLRQERERKIYQLHRPCLIAITDETRPSQVVLYALFGQSLKKVMLPTRLIEIDDCRAFKVVRWCIRNYLTRFKGHVPLWGKAKGFVYSKKPDENYYLTIDGDLISVDAELPSILRSATTVSFQ